jgi:CubicO group peptidase (beta-lactamase class C family)
VTTAEGTSARPIEPDSPLGVELSRRVRATAAGEGLPGLAVGVVRADGLAGFRGTGVTDLEAGTPPTDRTLSRVASITKTFTTTAIVQLRDHDRLALDDPLERHLPEFAAVRERGGRRADVTIRRLLTHRSGLQTEPDGLDWSRPRFPTPAELLAALPRSAVVIPADGPFKYSNLAFALLGEVVTRAAARPYAFYVREAILEPLGMVEAGFDLSETRRALLATGHSPGFHADRPRIAPHPPMDGMAAAGQLYASVRDLARWLAFQLRGDSPRAGARPVLDPRSLAEIHRPVYLEPDWSSGQALGWRLTRVGERVHHNHGGGIHGFASSVAFNRPGGVGAIVLANLWPSAVPARLALELIDATLDADAASAASGLTGQTSVDPGRPAAGSTLAPAPASLAGYLGRYRAEPGIEVLLEFRAGQLLLVPADPAGYLLHAPARLEPTGAPDTLRVVDGRGAGEVLAFDRDGAAIRAFGLGGFLYQALRPSSVTA